MTAIVQTKTGNIHPGTTLTIALDNPTVSGNAIFVIVLNTFTGTGGSVFSVADGVNTYTQAVTSEDGGNFQFSSMIFYSQGITGAGSPSIVITNANSGEYAAVVLEVSGSKTSGGPAAVNHNNQSTTTPSTGNAVLPTAGIALIGLAHNQFGTITVDAAWTSVINNLGGPCDGSYQIGPSATYNGGWTDSVNAATFAVIAVFEDATVSASNRSKLAFMGA